LYPEGPLMQKPKWEVRVHMEADWHYLSHPLSGLKRLARAGEIKLTQEVRWNASTAHYPHDPMVMIAWVRPYGGGPWKGFCYDARDRNTTFDRTALNIGAVYYKSNYHQQVIDDTLSAEDAARIRPAGYFIPNNAFADVTDYRVSQVKTVLAAFFPLGLEAARHAFAPTEGKTISRFRHLAQRVNITYQRLQLEAYEKAWGTPPIENQVFFNGSAWDMTSWDGLISRRYDILKRIKAHPAAKFVGGFRDTRDARSHFPDMVANPDYNHRQYFEEVGRSDIVLATLGLFDCLAWKVPEYMASGRTIISEPLINQLPAAVRHGEEMYFFQFDLSDFDQKFDQLVSSPELRQHIAAGARRYFEAWVRPDAVMRRILEECLNLREPAAPVHAVYDWAS
ncbi:MAG: glycosyltransferase, partial [bacterium]|nr:glycosyltransferase [bacterium]